MALKNMNMRPTGWITVGSVFEIRQGQVSSFFILQKFDEL